MNQNTASGSLINKLLGYALIVCSLWLVFNAVIAAQLIDRPDFSYSNANIYLSPVVSKGANLNALFEREAKRRELSFWNQDRLKLAKELSKILRQRINLTPFDGELWLQLSYLEKEAGVNINDRAWTLGRAAKLLKWNDDQRSKITYHCIVDYEGFRLKSAKLCSSLITNLPAKWTDGTKAQKVGVKLDDLQKILDQELAGSSEGGAQ